jgi:GrpB-like predicted nucleotidyltransferase (UPF0157 family)
MDWPSAKEITTLLEFEAAGVEILSTRPQRLISIVDSDATWPATFAAIESRIQDALRASGQVLHIEHVGSTSVPGLPAKPVIDIDLIVRDPTDEASYVPGLEAAGFQFLLREPPWYEHRLFGLAEPNANLHVFGPACAEHARHVLFRDWLRNHPEDRERYVNAKRDAAKMSNEKGETMNEYNARKERVIRDILARIFRAKGLLEDEPGKH